ncbi:MAG: hypothetical protein QOI88_1100 [Gammaproteobacteria bacterium]|nr:hypothetical protein [Gammaproteobacteria bacterium]
MAAVTQKRARRLAVFAIVAALHAGVCWLLLEATRPFKIGTAVSSLELIYLTLGVPENPAKGPAQAHRSQPVMRPSVDAPPLNQPRPRTQPSAAAPGEEDNAIHPPIDWANELNRTARESASGESAPKPREFGAPHVAPTPPAKRPVFGWSHSRTHRVETGPGSLAIHLGDHCVIAFTPLPVTVCTAGKTEANGDLFKHMRDPPQAGDWKDPQ